MKGISESEALARRASGHGNDATLRPGRVEVHGMGYAIDQATNTRIRYAIQIEGTLGKTVLGAFPELEPAFRDGDTILIGQLADQPALHGVLAQI